MSERDYAPLSIACVRGLCDKIYDKRKFAGAEIEKMVKDFSDANNCSQIARLIRVLGQDLMASTNPNVKNGALMGLSSVAVGLGKGSTVYLAELIHPIVACFSESESRVRYQAAEALFNVVKIARGATLLHFPVVFEALARLAADSEPQVKQAAELLDRLVKDIVTESPSFDLSSFVPLLRERMYARGGGARQFAAAWVAALDALPALDLAPHLPDLLDPLFKMLDDANPEIRRLCEVQLHEFLRGVQRAPRAPRRAQCTRIINILITHAQSPEPQVQLTALTWLAQFVSLCGADVSPYASGVLAAALPCLAHTDEQRRNIRETAASVNLQLTKLVGELSPESVPPAPSESEERSLDAETAEGDAHPEFGEDTDEETEPEGGLNVDAVVSVLTMLLNHSSVHTKVAALDWILHLYNKMPSQMCGQTERVFTACVCLISDAADDVVRRALAVLAEICSAGETGELESSPHYHKLLRALLRMLAADDALMEDRGAFIIRQLCVLLNAEAVYVALADTIRSREECPPRAAASLVAVLSTLLLTSAELYDLRQQLRRFDTPETHALFRALYSCWCHSPVALLALCLLTHNYKHCNDLINTFGDLEITVDFLTEVDKLVQLIESPIFAYLRLELLSGAQSSSLRGALYGLLMLLPQTEAFHTLRRRLQCAPPLHAEDGDPPPPPCPPPALDFPSMLNEFRSIQQAHRRDRMMDRSRTAAYTAA